MTNNVLPLERELLVQLSWGSKEAFEKIYNFYSPKIYGKLLKLLKSKPDADEVLQEVFLRIWELRETIDPDKPFGAYMFRIAMNKAYDIFRKAESNKRLNKQLVKSSAGSYSHVEEKIVIKEDAGILHMAINSLPPQRRQVFMLCKMDGKSYKEVSLSLGISTSTISDHIVKATRYIRKHFIPR